MSESAVFLGYTIKQDQDGKIVAVMTTTNPDYELVYPDHLSWDGREFYDGAEPEFVSIDNERTFNKKQLERRIAQLEGNGLDASISRSALIAIKATSTTAPTLG
jgi:hypothetical protein